MSTPHQTTTELPIVKYHRYRMEHDNKCEMCGCSNHEKHRHHQRFTTKLDVVHLDEDLKNFKPGNLFSVCQFCRKSYTLEQLHDAKHRLLIIF